MCTCPCFRKARANLSNAGAPLPCWAMPCLNTCTCAAVHACSELVQCLWRSVVALFLRTCQQQLRGLREGEQQYCNARLAPSRLTCIQHNLFQTEPQQSAMHAKRAATPTSPLCNRCVDSPPTSNHRARVLRHSSRLDPWPQLQPGPARCAACRQMMMIDVMPEFAMLRGSNAIWSRMQAGRARTADLRAVLHSVTAATHALNLPAAGPLMHALLRVATWTLGGCTCDTPAALLERCRWVVRRLEPLLPAVVDEFGAEVSNEDAEADRVRKELQEHGLDVEELPVNVDAVVFFFRCAVLRCVAV